MTEQTVPKRGRGRPPGPPVDPEVRREELLDAAERAIRKTGRDVSMADVAAEAGLTRSAVYAAFADRATILAAVTKRFEQRALARFAESLGRQATVDEDTTDLYLDSFGRTSRPGLSTTAGLLRAMIDAWAAFYQQDPELALTIEEATLRNGLDPASLAGVTALLQRGFDEYGIDRPGQAETWAVGIHGAARMVLRHWAQSPVETRPSRDAVVDHVTSLLWQGTSVFDRWESEKPEQAETEVREHTEV